MFKNGLFVVLLLMLGAGVVWARNVDVDNVSISNVDAGAGTCTINYTLSRTEPAVSDTDCVWIFVKYRLTTDSDYTGWQDTDDHTATNDDSEGRFTGNNGSQNAVSNTVNKYLTGDVGIVSSASAKQIAWPWGGSGTGLSSTNSVQVRVYAVEMVRVPDGGAMTFGYDTSASGYITSGTYDPSSAYYLMKYPCTAEMYAAFLNCCVNRHDPSANGHHDFYSSYMTNGGDFDRLDMTGTIGTDAVFTANSGQKDYAMTMVTWYNAYDWCKWAGLRMPTEEEFEYEASDVGARDFPWGEDVPNTTDNIRCNMTGVSPSHASDVRSYDGYGAGLDGLSAHNAAELSGNVRELEFTRYYSGSYNSDYSTDSNYYAGYGSGSDRFVRGGNWFNDASWMRAGSRDLYSPSNRNHGVGFRAAKLP